MKSSKPRKHNPEWKDSREARAARQAKRLSRLNAIAQAAGYDTWRKLETAALGGEVINLNAPEEVSER